MEYFIPEASALQTNIVHPPYNSHAQALLLKNFFLVLKM